MNEYKMNKKAISVCSLHSKENDKKYWLSKTPIERLEFVEFLRQTNYGYDPTTTRLQRFFEFAELS
jgi:hypothetical protein